jgi:hypothetical protein
MGNESTPSKRCGVRLALLTVAGLSTAPLVAHHGNSAFDVTQIVTLEGTVTRWQFINPHAGIHIEVVDEQGAPTAWSGEFQSIQDLYRSYSWNKDTFKPGDRVTLIGNPDRNGRPAMWVSKVIFADGREVAVRD